jgi:hypothetical protein
MLKFLWDNKIQKGRVKVVAGKVVCVHVCVFGEGG